MRLIHSIKLLLFFYLFSYSLLVFSKKLIDADVQNIIQKAPTDLNIAVKITSMDTDKVIYALNANHHFIVASTQKILTAAAALLYLGGSYRFQTTVYSSADKIINHHLNGNLYLKLVGDPSFDKEALQNLLKQIKNKGIERVDGDLYIDANRFDNQTYGPGWMWDDTPNCFSAPVHTMMINHNCFHITVTPSARVGRPAILGKEDEISPPIQLINQVITKNFDPQNEACELRVQNEWNNPKVYRLKGCLTPRQSPYIFSLAVPTAEPYFLEWIHKLLKEEKLTIAGKIKYGSLPLKKDFIIANWASAPLAELIKTMLKKSDNLIADSLFKTLGATYFSTQGNWGSGSRATRQILNRAFLLNLDPDHIADGSGLSRYDLITADQLSEILLKTYKNEKIGGIFLEALPIAGVDGSLKNFVYAHDLIYNKFYAKTGSMTGVFNLAGYLYTQNNHILSVVILMNNLPGKKKIYKNFMLELLHYLAKTF